MERPDWLDKHPREWPAPARVAYGILIRAAMRRAERQQEPPPPPGAHPR